MTSNLSLKEQINADFIKAYKAKDETLYPTLRLLRAAINQVEVDTRNKDLTDDDIIKILKTELKRRLDSIVLYQQGGRADLVRQEDSEKRIIERYLPQQMSEEHIRTITKDVIAKIGATALTDFGRVMGLVMKETGGNADGLSVKKIVQELLG